jgi:hypothetical protein
LSPAAPHQLFRVNLVVFVVETKHVHCQVDRQTHGQLALIESARLDGKSPTSAALLRQCSHEIMLRQQYT